MTARKIRIRVSEFRETARRRPQRRVAKRASTFLTTQPISLHPQPAQHYIRALRCGQTERYVRDARYVRYVRYTNRKISPFIANVTGNTERYSMFAMLAASQSV
jgi:hypothetical protein